MAREFSRSFYRSKQWKDVREYVIRRDKYLCQRCGRPAEEVHHIIHLTPENIHDNNIALSADNLISLCRDCHQREHVNDKIDGMLESKGLPKYGYVFGADGQLVPK